ncbi:MAG: Hsp70 family protein, partial [Anaerolineae bacterium]|nr:Hsp70 family protein [Anaerolineae bacterium]
VETLGGVATPMIERNTTIPTKKSQVYSTAADGQTQVEIHVVQGERPMAADNKSLGKFILDGIPPAPRGVPQVEVTFDIDANGILNVSAQDKATGREQKITITASSGLAEDEIQRMVQEAEQHASDDAKRREAAELQNRVESTIFSAEKLLRDFDEKLPEDAKKQTREKIDELRKAQESNDPTKIESTMEALAQHIQSLGGRMYEQTEADPNAQQQPGAEESKKGPDDEDVVDAEFTEA